MTYIHGEITGSAYKVFIETVEEGVAKILYFNEDGSLRNEDFGTSGFLISGLASGLHTVRIQPENSDKYILQQIYVDERASHYISIDLSK